MRGWRKTLVVAAALTAALGAAVGGDAMAAGKALVVGLVAEPTSMDPGQLTDINSMRVLSSVYDTLVRFKEGSFTQEPGLATAWKMSPDGLTYTFTLRRNVKFHDGTPFDADAVKFTYDRLLDPKHPFAETGPFPFASFYYGAIKEVAVVDPGTVRFTLKQPFSPLLNNLTLNTGRIVSPAAVKKYGKEFASTPPESHRGRAARQRGPGEEGGHAHVLRAAGPSHLVGDPQHREEALQRRAGASGGQSRGEPRRDHG
jgi:peptide/nickel transport system substrate-binding protein